MISDDVFQTLDQTELLELFRSMKKLEKELEGSKPQTKEELWAWIKKETGFAIPRVSICPDHDAPMDFMWDLFSGQTENALLIANRGGSKTQNLAILHYANSVFKPGLQGLTAASTETAAKRCYEYLVPWLYQKKDGKSALKDYVNALTIDKTKFSHGGSVENLAATVRALNGPHTSFTHADEVEIWEDEQAWKEFKNIPVAKQYRDEDGVIHEYPAQVVLTSTRKYPAGRIQNIVDEVNEAKAKGLDPAYRIYIWCVHETIQKQSNCREAPENKGKSEEELCSCNKIPSGNWKDGNPRTLNQICGGGFYRADGYRPLKEVQNTFRTNDQDTWEAQQECKRPSADSNYIKNWDLGTHGLKDYVPDPENGPIHMGVDFGATDPNGVLWIQLIKKDGVIATDWHGNEIELQKNTFVIFDEIYINDISASQLGKLVQAREDSWSHKFNYPFKVKHRYGDPQAKMARMDFSDATGAEWSWFAPNRNFEDSVTRMKELFKDQGRIYVVQHRVPMFCQEVAVWHHDEKGKEVGSSHSVDAARYAIVNMFVDEMIDLAAARSNPSDFQKTLVSDTLYRRVRRYGKTKGPIGFDVQKPPLELEINQFNY